MHAWWKWHGAIGVRCNVERKPLVETIIVFVETIIVCIYMYFNVDSLNLWANCINYSFKIADC